MNTALNPATLRALKTYGRRRRLQLLVRGLCVTLLAAVAVLINPSLSLNGHTLSQDGMREKISPSSVPGSGPT